MKKKSLLLCLLLSSVQLMWCPPKKNLNYENKKYNPMFMNLNDENVLCILPLDESNIELIQKLPADDIVRLKKQFPELELWNKF